MRPAPRPPFASWLPPALHPVAPHLSSHPSAPLGIEEAVPLGLDPTGALERTRTPEDREPAEQSGSVVIIEDDQPTRILLRDVLLSAGIPVLPFASGFEALSSLKRCVPGLLVLDWHLPEMNGRAVIEHLQAYLGRLPPVLVLTGDVRLKVASHVTEVIRKPLSLERLVERVRTLMSPP